MLVMRVTSRAELVITTPATIIIILGLVCSEAPPPASVRKRRTKHFTVASEVHACMRAGQPGQL